MSPPLIKTFFPLLRAVSRIKNKKIQKQLLRELKKDKLVVKCMREVALNTIKQNIRFSASDKKKLNRHSTIIRSLAKKRSLEQAGGYLNIVLPILATVLSDLLLPK